MQEPKTIRLELSAENRIFENRCHTVSGLHPKAYEIRNALQKIRPDMLPGWELFERPGASVTVDGANLPASAPCMCRAL